MTENAFGSLVESRLYEHGRDESLNRALQSCYLGSDVAFRHARTEDRTFNEVRLGLTWSFALGK
jgi:hypothetical protein